MQILESVLMLALGLVFFLYGMNVMSANLEKLAGSKLEGALKKATANPFVGLLLGAGITIAIQSSSATTVMLVGLVNSGIMKFSQTWYVIFGANIGTTLTAWILSLSGLDSSTNVLLFMLKPEHFSPVLALIGILMLMASKVDRKKSIGTILIGFAVLMYGMEIMADAVEPLTKMDGFGELLVKFNNPVIGVVVGALFTALIQSSAASVGILQALAMSPTSTITYAMAIPIIMGQNIGTCITAILACIGTNANAKRVAAIHLAVNTIGTVILLGIYTAADAIFNFTFSGAKIDAWGISLMHTIFNVAITIILSPFGKYILRAVERIIKDDKKPVLHDEYAFTLDQRLLRSPSVAVGECSNYTVKMSEVSGKALNASMCLLYNYNENTVNEILENEERLDKLEDNLGSYLVKLSGQALSTPDSRKISKMLHTIGDFERLGDHAVNLMRTAKEIHTKGIVFSKEATRELEVLKNAVSEIVEITMQAFKDNNTDLAAKVEPLEQVIDGLAAQIKNNHIERLQTGECTIELGFVLSDLLNNYSRISDHCSNIAVAVIELVHGSFDTHKYLTEVKYGGAEFGEDFKEYKFKYSLS